jgi:hypothetical protein
MAQTPSSRGCYLVKNFAHTKFENVRIFLLIFSGLYEYNKIEYMGGLCVFDILQGRCADGYSKSS